MKFLHKETKKAQCFSEDIYAFPPRCSGLGHLVDRRRVHLRSVWLFPVPLSTFFFLWRNGQDAVVLLSQPLTILYLPDELGLWLFFSRVVYYFL